MILTFLFISFQREIAEILDVTERTVRNYLKNPAPPKKKPVRKSKLDPHKPFIDSILKEDLYYNCENLCKRLITMGYTGKISILRDYVARIRQEEEQRVVIRFETEPGYQAQVDRESSDTPIRMVKPGKYMHSL